MTPMEHLARQLLTFLHEAGYEHAWVHVEGSIMPDGTFMGQVLAGPGEPYDGDRAEFDSVASNAYQIVLKQNHVIMERIEP